jgi:hypothetical protein
MTDEVGWLECPECAADGHTGRIGNRRTHCGLCNRFTQAVMRTTRSKLRERHPDEYEQLRLEAERECLPRLVADYQRRQLHARADAILSAAGLGRKKR